MTFRGRSARFNRSAFEIGRADLRALEQLATGPGERDQAVDHDVAAVGELERVERVLLDQEHGELVLAVEVANRGENLFDQEWREAERRLVEQQEPRPPHESARDRQHLLLAARKRAAALAQPLL